MIKLKKTPKLDKSKLVLGIKEKFLHLGDYMYQRKLFEFIDEEGNYLGDNFFETTFKFRPSTDSTSSLQASSDSKPPIVYEITGPYDSVSKKFAAVARVYYKGDLVFQYDHNDGIAQRTAAITWLYIDALEHKLGNVLIYGPGLISTHVVDYLKHFNPKLESIDYVHYEKAKPDFEKNLKKMKVQAEFVKDADLSKYDTIILATTTKEYCITKKNIKDVKPGTFIVSLCTTSAVGEIEPCVYGMDNVQLFLDYEQSKSFVQDLKEAVKRGLVKGEIYLDEVLSKRFKHRGLNKWRLNQMLKSKINILRLTGTPMQNIVVMEMMILHYAQDKWKRLICS